MVQGQVKILSGWTLQLLCRSEGPKGYVSRGCLHCIILTFPRFSGVFNITSDYHLNVPISRPDSVQREDSAPSVSSFPLLLSWIQLTSSLFFLSRPASSPISRGIKTPQQSPNIAHNFKDLFTSLPFFGSSNDHHVCIFLWITPF